MPDTATLRIQVELENPARPGLRRALVGLLVNTGSMLSWVPGEELEALGIQRTRLMRFRRAAGQVIERWVGFATVHVGGIDTVDDAMTTSPNKSESSRSAPKPKQPHGSRHSAKASRPLGGAVKRLSWNETAKAMAAASEDLRPWDAVVADGLESVPWESP